MNKPEQTGFDIEPDYPVSSTGTQHEFNGLLLVPTPDEMKRITEEQKAREYGDSLVIGLRIKKQPIVVKMNPLDGLRLRKGKL